MPQKFRKKPVVIEAVLWTGNNLDEILDFSPSAYTDYGSGKLELKIQTLEGHHIASIGDWIIKGVAGEFYPCKPDIFEQTYEAV
jgi:hypothetical protein